MPRLRLKWYFLKFFRNCCPVTGIHEKREGPYNQNKGNDIEPPCKDRISNCLYPKKIIFQLGQVILNEVVHYF
jgi:hypothetical protein